MDSTTLEVILYPGLSKTPFRHIQDWVKQLREVSKITTIQYSDDLAQDLDICRAARLLGMEEHV
jgi:hypothetical protein